MDKLVLLLVIPFLTWFGTFYYYQVGMQLVGCIPSGPACQLYRSIYGHRLGFLGVLFCWAALNLLSPLGHYFQMKPENEQYYEAAIVMSFVGILLLFIYQGLLRNIGNELAAQKAVEHPYFVHRRIFINSVGCATFIVCVAILIGAIYGSR
jgi:hypothetical protein